MSANPFPIYPTSASIDRLSTYVHPLNEMEILHGEGLLRSEIRV